MLKAANRLKKQADFLRLYSSSRKLVAGPFIILSSPNGLSHPRFGVVVSKKISKKAVVRNKIRRSLSVLLEPLQTEKSLSGQDFIIQLKAIPEAEQKQPFRYLAPFIDQWFRRLSI